MHALRFAQYAILTASAMLIVCYFAVTSAGRMVFTRILGFGDGTSLSDQVFRDPLLPTIVAVAIFCTLLLELLRVRLQKKNTSSG